MKLLFANFSALEFTAATPDAEPLGGSESSLCYLARELARRGHGVALAARLPENAATEILGVRHFPLAAVGDAGFFAAERFDAIIVCNAPAACAPLKAASGAKVVSWMHVLPDQPSMQVLRDARTHAACDAAVFVSAWQQGEVERAFGSFPAPHVIGNGIAPAFADMFASADELLRAKEDRAIYAATPYRGLSVLVRAMEGLERPTRLDLFSSMKLYQGRDDEYAPLFARAAQNPAIANRGAVGQAELARHLRGAAFLFYPSIYAETFCISAAEALAAGLHAVTTRLGALPETMMGYADLVPVESGDGDALAGVFRTAMRRAIDDRVQSPAAWAERRFEQARRANRAFAWGARAQEWEKLLGLP